MSAESIEEEEDPIVKTERFVCEICGDTLSVPIRESDAKQSSGGIFRVATTHDCAGGQRVHFLFFDARFTVRQKVTTRVVSSVTGGQEGADAAASAQQDSMAMVIGADPGLLLQRFREATAQILAAAMEGNQIVFFGSNANEVKICALGLKALLPNMDVNIIPWTEGFSDADVLGTDLNNSKAFVLAAKADVDSGMVQHGVHNSFCNAIIDTLLMTEPSVLSDVVQQYYVRLNDQLKVLRAIKSADDVQLILAAMAYDDVDPDEAALALGIASRENPAVGVFQNVRASIGSGSVLDVLVIDDTVNLSSRLEIQSSRIARMNGKLGAAFLELIPTPEEGKIAIAEAFTPREHVIGLHGARQIAMGFERMANTKKALSATVAMMQTYPRLLNSCGESLRIVEGQLQLMALVRPDHADLEGPLTEYTRARDHLGECSNTPQFFRFYLPTEASLTPQRYIEALGRQFRMFEQFDNPRLARYGSKPPSLVLSSADHSEFSASISFVKPSQDSDVAFAVVDLMTKTAVTDVNSEKFKAFNQFCFEMLIVLDGWIEDNI